MYSIVDRDLQNAKRTAVEDAIMRGGLVQVAGGTRYRYFGQRGDGVTGLMLRVGVRTFRIVNRVRGSAGIFDQPADKEHFHGKVDLNAVTELAYRLNSRDVLGAEVV